jgi:hypothetical protein
MGYASDDILSVGSRNSQEIRHWRDKRQCDVGIGMVRVPSQYWTRAVPFLTIREDRVQGTMDRPLFSRSLNSNARYVSRRFCFGRNMRM